MTARGGLVSSFREHKAGKSTRVPYDASGVMCEGPDSGLHRALMLPPGPWDST
jgi:hypothetical protein